MLQIDAHIDWRDEVQGERWGLSSTMRRASEMTHVKRMIQVGKRGIGSARAADYQAALDWGVQFFSGRDVHRDGVANVLDALPADANVIVSLDCDGLDSINYPRGHRRAPGGLGYWQTLEIIHGVAEKANLVGFDIVEFMPEQDVDGLGALVCARIVDQCAGFECLSFLGRGKPDTVARAKRLRGLTHGAESGRQKCGFNARRFCRKTFFTI